MPFVIGSKLHDRERARCLFPHGDLIEFYCAAPMEMYESRDVKGLYARARAGEVKEFTGISSRYEPPLKPELVVDRGGQALEERVAQVMGLLRERGVVG